MSRPRAAPGLLATLASQAPKRLVRKLDKQPELADEWSWTETGGVWQVQTSGEAIVTLRPEDGVVATLEHASCDCLLAPRCLHLLAVAHRLEVAEGGETAEPEDDAPVDDAEVFEPDAQQRAAAAQAWQAGSRLLAAGATAAGTLQQAELLRAVHGCRIVGLHRAASAGLRVVTGARALRSEAPQFSLPQLADDLRELLAVSWQLSRAPRVDAAWLGTARRAYRDLGSLRVWGLFSEPVISATGYSGVVTYLCDGDDRLWTLSDIMPGEPSRARAAYGAGIEVGDASLPHRELARAGLFLSNATGSRDGRLGSGAQVKAVRAAASTLADEGPAALWAVPLEQQLQRAGGARAGADLCFLDGVVLGGFGGAMLVALADDSLLRCVAPTDHASLCYVENLELLARHPGLRLRMVGRVELAGPRTLALLAVGPLEGEGPALTLPDDWGGRCCLGLDRLQGAHVTGRAEPVELPFDPSAATTAEEPDPTDELRRRLQRMALGGRGTLPSAAMPGLEREAARLEARLMPSGARVLRDLGGAALPRKRETTGALDAVDPDALAQAWLAASVYDQAATIALRRLAWAR